MKPWRARIAIVWSIFWMAFGLGCIQRTQGNSMVHAIVVMLHIPLLVTNVYLFFKFKKEQPE